MTQNASDQGPERNGTGEFGSIAEELKRTGERLRQLAEELKAREQALAEMQADYPHLKKAVYALLREKFAGEVPPIPNDDLEALVAAEGGLDLEEFIDELERMEEGQ